MRRLEIWFTDNWGQSFALFNFFTTIFHDCRNTRKYKYYQHSYVIQSGFVYLSFAWEMCRLVSSGFIGLKVLHGHFNLAVFLKVEGFNSQAQ